MTEQPADDNHLGARVGEYEITSLLGKGGMGTVYGGVHPIIGTDVAIKIIDPILARDENLVARFVQEARAVNKIRHPNIINIFAFGEAPGIGHYFVMPKLYGQSLAERVSSGPMSLEEATPILEQLADALDAAHAQGILHRDLKPENIFIETTPQGQPRVRVLDFGLAKLNDSDAVAVSSGHHALGTPLVMAPEQWDGVGVDHRADVYALGIVVHFMLTGRYPFQDTSSVGLMKKHLTEEPSIPSAYGATSSADPVVARALEKDKSKRFSSASELCKALSSATGSVSRKDLRRRARRRSSVSDLGFAATMHPAAALDGSNATGRLERKTTASRNTAMLIAVAVLGLLVAAALRWSGVFAGSDSDRATSEGRILRQKAATSPPPERPTDSVDEGSQTAAAAQDSTADTSLEDNRTLEEQVAETDPTRSRLRPASAGRRPRYEASAAAGERTPAADAEVQEAESADPPRKKESEWGATLDPFSPP